MTTLFTATLSLARILGNVRNSVTTAIGSSTTLVDSTRTELIDYWNGGALWITSGTHAGKSRVITDWALSGTTFTIPTTTTAAGNGVTYSVIDPSWPLDKLIDAINQALAAMGEVPEVDATLTTVANQRAYALPSGVYNVRQVRVAGNTNDPLDYRPSYRWRELDGYIEFDAGAQPADAGYTLRLIYHKAHAAMSADTDVISDYVHPDRLVWTAAVNAWRWRVQMAGKNHPEYTGYLNEASQRAELLARRHPVPVIPKAPRLP